MAVQALFVLHVNSCFNEDICAIVTLTTAKIINKTVWSTSEIVLSSVETVGTYAWMVNWPFLVFMTETF